MAAPATTKDRILHAAEDLMRTKSFHSVGLSEILAAVKVPKGSFYHYFDSKEQFGIELVRHYVEEQAGQMRKFLSAAEGTALERFSEYWGYLIGQLTAGECRRACLVAKLGLEVANFSEGMRVVLAEGMASWRALHEGTVRAGQKDGSIRKELKPAETAAAIQDTWQGAMQRAQVEKSVAPLRTAKRFLLGHLTAR